MSSSPIPTIAILLSHKFDDDKEMRDKDKYLVPLWCDSKQCENNSQITCHDCYIKWKDKK